MDAYERENLHWLMQEVEKTERDIRSILQDLSAYERVTEGSPDILGIDELWSNIASALRAIGLDDIVIQTLDQAMEDFQKGANWARLSITAPDPYRPLACWSIERLCRAQRGLISVSASVTKQLCSSGKSV